MSTWTGRLVRLDLGGGGWALETRDGRYLLAGAVPAGLQGQEIVVEGTVSSSASFLMTGDPVIFVTRSRTV